MATKLKVYLAGTKDENTLNYRKVAKRKFGNSLNLFDPFTEVEKYIVDYNLNNTKNLTDEQIEKIVVQDKEAIKTCDILVAYVEYSTFGTTMEILYAWNNNIPVYVINPNKKLINDVWLKYHTTSFFETTDECFKYILKGLGD